MLKREGTSAYRLQISFNRQKNNNDRFILQIFNLLQLRVFNIYVNFNFRKLTYYFLRYYLVFSFRVIRKPDKKIFDLNLGTMNFEQSRFDVFLYKRVFTGFGIKRI